MTLLLVRHGETALNAARVLQTADTPLSERGLLQARAVAARLLALRPAAVISSDQARALQTAQAIAAITGLALQTTPLLQERNFGVLRGQPYDGLAYNPLTMAAAPEGGESQADFLQRIDQAFTLIVGLQRGCGAPLVVVTHGLVIRSWLGVQVALAQALPARIGNTSLTIVRSAPPHLAELVNCTTHLQGVAAENEAGLAGG